MKVTVHAGVSSTYDLKPSSTSSSMYISVNTLHKELFALSGEDDPPEF